MLGEVAAVYDRGALVSFDPPLRGPYVEHLAGLTLAGVATLLITLEYDQRLMPGPPFSIDAAEVRRLYGPGHSIQELSRRDALPDEPRMRAKGVTALAEVCYRISRR
jgi:thiopurine S-methyltransferase